MNTLLAIILGFQLAVIPSHRHVSPKRVTSSACATTDTSILHDELIEGFQTASTGYENTWTQVGTTGNITAAADSTSLTSNKPTGACNQAWKLTIPTDGTETYAYWDRGSSITVGSQVVDLVAYLYIETAPDTGESFYIWSAGNNSGLPATVEFRVQLINNAGTLQLFAFGGNASASVNVSSGQWIKMAVHLDTSTTGTLSTFTVNDGTANGFNRNNAGLRYVFFGTTSSLDTNDSGTIWFDLLCVNTP